MSVISSHSYCPPPELAIIVPTYNEADSVAELVRRVATVLDGIAWEIIVVDDDSPDATAERVRELARQDARVRLIQRIGRRGLSSACIEGMLATTAPFLAVMDGDLQHDETLLPQMLATLKTAALDIVIGSRYIAGGGVGKWNTQRQWMSRLATRIGQRLIHAELHDPMSGFFMVRANVIHQCVHHLSGVGFKILLDIFFAAPTPLRFQELPFTFRQRLAGASKLESAVLWEYLLMLAQKLIGTRIPVRFIAFSLIGGLGVAVHMAVLWPMLHLLGESVFLLGQATATLVAMTSNFFLNNLFTYRDQRLIGRQLLWGWLSFVLVCGLGALANVGIANALFQQGNSGWFFSALAGILVGAVWNYAVTAVYTWKSH
ncbi:glycosyltransferase [Chromatium okenii]|uniref:Dolichol monophosphate mannose synthase n=1 Tax=Chromatium okenii TaxID=61644 RepID=A0A2S7XUN3_9GAMM|nr:glycosyltransferase family 2 protein [Chromatium okenii]PQJ95483.1 dolichol monophosphate mannose synthase [Chromatium okenii]PQJ97457.1 dolichol monophosphate mannose synthase [Chromatium okenii]